MDSAKSGGGRLKIRGVAISKRPKKKKSGAAGSIEHQVEEVRVPNPEPGSGRIVSSGVTVHGFETKFREEAAIGDVIILFHPKQLQDEERVVTAVLSQRSLTLHKPFSSDIASTTPYRLRKESILLAAEAEEALKTGSAESSSSTREKPKLQDEISRRLKKKLDEAKSTLTYREKTGMWGYRVVSEEVSKNMSAEEMLDLRVKKMGRDKFCW